MCKMDMKRCRCSCHRIGGTRHAVPCCCVHRYKRDCPHPDCPRNNDEPTEETSCG